MRPCHVLLLHGGLCTDTSSPPHPVLGLQLGLTPAESRSRFVAVPALEPCSLHRNPTEVN